ncbi:hypothetical protein KSP40_PGU015430 [Platanthera guangdongensis]|uniref:Uncharacterized protein n=1 Tax=Platanthera guangdongensis TaxID=2320717 RepID=A0ABR2LHK2_9ASPA
MPKPHIVVFSPTPITYGFPSTFSPARMPTSSTSATFSDGNSSSHSYIPQSSDRSSTTSIFFPLTIIGSTIPSMTTHFSLIVTVEDSPDCAQVCSGLTLLQLRSSCPPLSKQPTTAPFSSLTATISQLQPPYCSSAATGQPFPSLIRPLQSSIYIVEPQNPFPLTNLSAAAHSSPEQPPCSRPLPSGSTLALLQSLDLSAPMPTDSHL